MSTIYNILNYCYHSRPAKINGTFFFGPEHYYKFFNKCVLIELLSVKQMGKKFPDVGSVGNNNLKVL